jgi:putative transposase
MDPSLAARLNEFEDENRRLEKLCTDERLKAEITQDGLKKSGKVFQLKQAFRCLQYKLFES